VAAMASIAQEPRSACALPGQSRDDPACPRCSAPMIWTKASWHCLACRYKEGCCG